MTQRAGIQPYFTNHSLRATTVTILSSVNVETRQIKAVTVNKSDASIESYCERPTLHQFQHMSSALTSFIQGKENNPPSRPTSSSASESTGSMARNTPGEISMSPIQNDQQNRPSFQRDQSKCDSTIGQFSWLFVHHKHQHQQVK